MPRSSHSYVMQEAFAFGGVGLAGIRCALTHAHEIFGARWFVVNGGSVQSQQIVFVCENVQIPGEEENRSRLFPAQGCRNGIEVVRPRQVYYGHCVWGWEEVYIPLRKQWVTFFTPLCPIRRISCFHDAIIIYRLFYLPFNSFVSKQLTTGKINSIHPR